MLQLRKSFVGALHLSHSPMTFALSLKSEPVKRQAASLGWSTYACMTASPFAWIVCNAASRSDVLRVDVSCGRRLRSRCRQPMAVVASPAATPNRRRISWCEFHSTLWNGKLHVISRLVHEPLELFGAEFLSHWSNNSANGRWRRSLCLLPFRVRHHACGGRRR